jgi:hypothetical protein
VNRYLVALLASVLLLLGVGPASGTATPSAPVTVAGVDLHDTTVKKFGDTYYMYGSMYGCGYEWYIANTPWCGFGVSTAPGLDGPWTAPKALFAPSSTDPSLNQTWQSTCGGTGQGCFNPRMIQRSGWGNDDGVFILWFNAPRQYTLGASNAYNSMGCNGPAGPCGPTAGAPSGSYTKPALDVCAANGDFGIIDSGQGGRPAIVCTRASNTGLSIQELNWSGTGGNTGVGTTTVAGITGAEGPGGWWDPVAQQYVLTYSDQGCGYCAGTPTGYAVSPSLYSGWTVPANVGWGAPVWGRRIFSPNSCGGQPRTVTVLDGQPYQIVDLWLGTRNETAADTVISPLSYAPATGAVGNVWVPPVGYPCR